MSKTRRSGDGARPADVVAFDTTDERKLVELVLRIMCSLWDENSSVYSAFRAFWPHPLGHKCWDRFPLLVDAVVDYLKQPLPGTQKRTPATKSSPSQTSTQSTKPEIKSDDVSANQVLGALNAIGSNGTRRGLLDELASVMQHLPRSAGRTAEFDRLAVEAIARRIARLEPSVKTWMSYHHDFA